MQYKMVLSTVDLSTLTGQAADQKAPQAAVEATDWNETLNHYSRAGWIVKNSSAVQSGANVVFWALLEKEEQEQAINTGF